MATKKKSKSKAAASKQEFTPNQLRDENAAFRNRVMGIGSVEELDAAQADQPAGHPDLNEIKGEGSLPDGMHIEWPVSRSQFASGGSLIASNSGRFPATVDTADRDDEAYHQHYVSITPDNGLNATYRIGPFTTRREALVVCGLMNRWAKIAG